MSEKTKTKKQTNVKKTEQDIEIEDICEEIEGLIEDLDEEKQTEYKSKFSKLKKGKNLKDLEKLRTEIESLDTEFTEEDLDKVNDGSTVNETTEDKPLEDKNEIEESLRESMCQECNKGVEKAKICKVTNEYGCKKHSIQKTVE